MANQERFTSLLTPQTFTQDLDRLVAFPTVTGRKKGFNEAFAFIKENLHPDAKVKMIKNLGERVLLATNRPTKTPDVLYLVHVDVVSVREGMEHQFKMKVDGDNAVGRGTNDMKFSIPIGWRLLNDLIESNSDLSFALAITTDEERGGLKGAAYLADTKNGYGLKPKIAIVPDGGKDFAIVYKSKGVCQVKVISPGSPAHSSTPWEGKNAIHGLTPFLAKFKERYEAGNSSETWETTANLGVVRGGELINEVPGTAEARIDYRFPETRTIKEVQEEARKFVAEIDPNLKIEYGATGVPTYVDPQNPVVQLYKSVMEKHTGRELPFFTAYGSSDARHFSSPQVPFLMNKPKGDHSHGDNEYVSISSSVLFYQALRAFLYEYSRTLQ